jgi:hypothetical protein
MPPGPEINRWTLVAARWPARLRGFGESGDRQAEDQPAAFAGVPHPGSQEWRPWDTISASDRMPPYFAISVLLLIALWQEREGPMLNSIELPEHTQWNLLGFQAN